MRVGQARHSACETLPVWNGAWRRTEQTPTTEGYCTYWLSLNLIIKHQILLTSTLKSGQIKEKIQTFLTTA